MRWQREWVCFGWSVAVAVEEIEGEEDVSEGKASVLMEMKRSGKIGLGFVGERQDQVRREWRLSLTFCQKEWEMRGLSRLVLMGDEGDGWKRKRKRKRKREAVWRSWEGRGSQGVATLGERRMVEWVEMDLGLGFLFVFFSFKIDPFLCICWKLLFIGKNIARFQTWSLNFFFFCKFWFFWFFLYFLKISNINIDSMRKINDFKNDAWKVEYVQKTFENLNYFETMLKMLKTM